MGQLLSLEASTRQLLVGVLAGEKGFMEPDQNAEGPFHGQRLIPALPEGTFVNPPPEIDRFTLRIFPGGRVEFTGSRARIDEFILACQAEGIELYVDHISFCG